MMMIGATAVAARETNSTSLSQPAGPLGSRIPDAEHVKTQHQQSDFRIFFGARCKNKNVVEMKQDTNHIKKGCIFIKSELALPCVVFLFFFFWDLTPFFRFLGV